MSRFTLIIVQQLRPDCFFTAAQQQRLEALMARWRAARDQGATLPVDEQTELEALIAAELQASAARAATLADALGRGTSTIPRWRCGLVSAVHISTRRPVGRPFLRRSREWGVGGAPPLRGSRGYAWGSTARHKSQPGGSGCAWAFSPSQPCPNIGLQPIGWWKHS